MPGAAVAVLARRPLESVESCPMRDGVREARATGSGCTESLYYSALVSTIRLVGPWARSGHVLEPCVSFYA